MARRRGGRVDSPDTENKENATSTQTGHLVGPGDQPPADCRPAKYCFHLQLALETRVHGLTKPHHDICNGVISQMLTRSLLSATRKLLTDMAKRLAFRFWQSVEIGVA